MSLGERLAQIRKENGLSQDAFGQTLNVTRQTVSKWELDQAFPEMGKLIEISKKYNVSIEWLIGIREERNDPTDLSEKQLQTVENILNKYLDKKPKRQYLNYVKYCLLAFGLFIIGSWGYNLNQTIDLLEAEIDSTKRYNEILSDSLASKIENLEDNIKEFIENQNSPFMNSLVEIQSYDPDTNTANLHIEIIPKEYRKDLEIQVLIENGENKKITHLIKDESKIYTADIQLELGNNLTINGIYKTNDLEKNEVIKDFGNILEGTKYRFDSSAYSNDEHVIYYHVDFELKSTEIIIPCDIEYVDTYIFVDDEFISKERNTVYKDEIKENCYEMEINKDFTEIINEYSKENDMFSIKYVHVITDEFNRTYAVSQQVFNYNCLQSVFEDSYEDNFIENFNWQDYE